MGHLGGEALLVAQARGDTGQQRVERRGQPGQLVARRAEVEAPVEVVLAPVGRPLGHVGDRAQGVGDGAPREQRPRGEDEEVEQQRPDERDVLGVVVGDERDPDDHRPRAAAPGAGAHRLAAQAHALADRALAAVRRPRKRVGRALDRRRRRRSLDRRDALVYPRLLVERLVVGRVAHHDATPADVQRRELGGGALAQRRRRIGVELAGEQQADPEGQQRQPGEEDERGRERHPVAEPQVPHRSEYPTPRAVAISCSLPSASSLRRRRPM
jgi:hypothetical protein